MAFLVTSSLSERHCFWLVFSARRSDYITKLICVLHWLKIPERIQLRLCRLGFRLLHGTTPPYLAESLLLTADVAARCRRRFANSSTLPVPPIRQSSLCDRAFPAAVSRAWNSLHSSVRSAASLPAFRRELKPCLSTVV